MARKRREYSIEEVSLGLTAFALEAGRRQHVERVLREAGLKIPYSTLEKWAYGEKHRDLYLKISHEVEKQVGTRLADQYHRLSKISGELSEEVLARIVALFRKKDADLADVDQRLQDAEDALREVNGRIDAAQHRIADALSIPDADALIEDILGEPGEYEVDDLLKIELVADYKRRDSIVAETAALWKRRDALEVGFKDLAKVLHESGVMGGIATEKLQALKGQPTQIVEHSFPEIRRALEAKGLRLLPPTPAALPAPEPIPLPVRSPGDDH